MTRPQPPAPPASGRALAREKARQRREDKAERREDLFELIVLGVGYEEVARRLGVSVKSVRREVDRALAVRQLDAPQRYIGLQMARLNKALRVAAVAVDGGEIKAVPTLIKVMGELDRYHGLAARLSQNREAAPAEPVPEALVGALPPGPQIGTDIDA